MSPTRTARPVAPRVATATARSQATVASTPVVTDRFVRVDETRTELAGTAAAGGTVACCAFNPTVWVVGSITGLVAPLVATVCSPCELTTTSAVN